MTRLRVILFLVAFVFLSYHHGLCNGVNSYYIDRLKQIRKRVNLHVKHSIKTIKSEDGEIIDCVTIYKQPAFNHPNLKDHKIQMIPSGESEMDSKSSKSVNNLKQVWEKYGSCPEGTIPIRRVDENALLKTNSSIEDYGRKPVAVNIQSELDAKNHTVNTLFPDSSVTVLITGVQSYTGGKADLSVHNPFVEREDEYSLAQIGLRNGPWEAVQAGWAVHPSLYRDHRTHFFIHWLADNARRGCFDLTCPGFVQTSRRIALGGTIDLNDIPVPGGLGGVLTLWVEKDVITKNWWVKTGNNQEPVGYFPADLFNGLQYTADNIQWGGEVHSKFITRHRPHTRTAMGSGHMGTWYLGAATAKIIRMRTNDPIWVKPWWTNVYTDEYDCYRADYMTGDEPVFFFGGPGQNPQCP